MKRRILAAGALGATAMVAGVLLPLLVVLFVPEGAAGVGAPVLTASNTFVMATVLLVLPGAIGLYLAHVETFGRAATAAVAALVGGFLAVFAIALAEFTVGWTPSGTATWTAVVGLLLVGSVGTGIATTNAKTLAHRRAGGTLLALSGVALLGATPLLARLTAPESLPAALPGLVATGPMGLAWLILGYDLLTLEDLSIQPTRIIPSKE